MALRCRTCFKLTQGEGAFKLEDKEQDSNLTVAEKLRQCVPQIAVNFIPNALMCANCLSYLNAAYDFRVMCLQVEERIGSCISNLVMLVNVGSPLSEMVHDGINGLRPLDGQLPPLYDTVEQQQQEQADDVEEVEGIALNQEDVLEEGGLEAQQVVQLGDDMKMEDIKDIEIIEDFESEDEDELSQVDIINDINQLMDAALRNGQNAKDHEPANGSLKSNPVNLIVQTQNNSLTSEVTGQHSINTFLPEEPIVVDEDNKNTVPVKKRKKKMPLGKPRNLKIKNGLTLPKKLKIKITKATKRTVKSDNPKSNAKPVNGEKTTFPEVPKGKTSASIDSEETLTCDLCGKVAATLRSLKIHTTRKHPDANLCFETPGKKPKVMNPGGKSSGSKLHKCPICGQMRVAIKRHLADVHYNAEFGCTTCDGYFPNEDVQAEHVIACEGRIYPCENCPLSFGTAATFSKHTFSHRVSWYE